MQTILFVPLHLQSPPLKFSGQPLQYELSKSNVPTFPASNHCRQWGFSVVKPQTTLSRSNAHTRAAGSAVAFPCGSTEPEGPRAPDSPQWIVLEHSSTWKYLTHPCLSQNAAWSYGTSQEKGNLALQEPIQSVTFSHIIKRDARQIHASWTSWSSPHLTAKVKFL